MKFETTFETPELIADILRVFQSNNAEIVTITDTSTKIIIEAPSEFDLGLQIRGLQEELVEEADIFVEFERPTPVDETETEQTDPGELKVGYLKDQIEKINAKSLLDPDAKIAELKELHTAVEDKLKEIAIEHKKYISLGEYGYGRAIDGTDYGYSGWDSSSEPDWESSSIGC